MGTLLNTLHKFHKESLFFSRLMYIETSAATGLNVSKAVDLLLERVMTRMENAVDKAMLPGRRGRPRDLNDQDINSIPKETCAC